VPCCLFLACLLRCLAKPGWINCERLAAQQEQCARPGLPSVVAAGLAQNPATWGIHCPALELIAHFHSLFFLICTAYTGAGLAQNRYFEDPAFLEYLRYLQYWQQPQYAQYIM
jgi:hypothetical protein